MVPSGRLPPMHSPFPRLAPGLFFFEVIEVSSEYDVLGRDISFTDFPPYGGSVSGCPWGVSVDYG
jgi:hypothetical protein